MIWILAFLFVLFVASVACIGGLVGSIYDDGLQLIQMRLMQKSTGLGQDLK